MKFVKRSRQRGFSMVELTVVTAIVLTVSATALPSIVRATYNVRLRSSASSLSGLMQSARMQAVRDNTYYYVCYATANNSMRAWVSPNNTCDITAMTGREQQVQLARNVQVATTGMPSTPSLSFTAPSGVLATAKPAFNSRGLPCYKGTSGTRCETIATTVSMSGSSSQTVSYVVYLTDSRPLGESGWAAVAASPAGRTQVWMYNGASWGR